MLRSLTIRDIVLIDRLEIDFGPGLTVLTGETGAGKSILLDSLGLALGARADQRLLRPGAETAQAAAFFENPPAAVLALLDERGVALDEGALILRRTLGADGRSRAFINDQPVSAGLLKETGEALVEVHGQFESHRLARPALHRALLDGFGRLDAPLRETRAAFSAWRAARDAVIEREAALAGAEQMREELERALEELDGLSPQSGEDEVLAERRKIMMNAENLAEALSDAESALNAGRGVDHNLQSAARGLIRAAEKGGGEILQPAIDALGRAQDAAAEAADSLNRVGREIEADPNALEKLEERLFALRAAARRHGVSPDDLPEVRKKTRAQLDDLHGGEAGLAKLKKVEAEARLAYETAADALGARRRAAAEKLDKAVNAELAPLKLEKARFRTAVSAVTDPDAWGPEGRDRAAFEVAANPGAPFGPMNKIASGGEIARFMLALKAVLAASDSVPTLIFDEVDSGVGGAVAAAVGERLAGLGRAAQVMVVTHAPQVAARGDAHYRISKTESAAKGVLTGAQRLDGPERTEEIARMLAGAKITDEARAAARALLGAEKAA
ncbi:MAG: DNA repair protein RecN [Rhodospirillales bacterium]